MKPHLPEVKYFALTPSHSAHLILECTSDKAGFAALNLDDLAEFPPGREIGLTFQAIGKLEVDF